MATKDKDAPQSEDDAKSGKFHYNPVNMSGKKAGILDELDDKDDGKSAPDAPTAVDRQKQDKAAR